MEKITDKTISASKWAILTSIVNRVIPALIFVILAKILVPEDFGLIAIAGMLIAFSMVFWEAGLTKALIYRENDLDAASHVVFWCNLVLSTTVYATLFLLAPWIAIQLGNVEIETVIRVLGLQILILSLTAVHKALYERSFQFKTLFWIQFSSSVIPGIISIILALQGLGYWALIVGTLCGNILQTLILWRVSHWQPKLVFDLQLAQELFRYGKWIVINGLLGWFYIWGDAFVVSIYLDTHELGLYRTGNSLVIMVYGMLFAAIGPVLFSMFSRYGDNRAIVSKHLRMVIKLFTYTSLIIASAIYITSPYLEQHILGEKWSGISTIISILVWTHGLSWIIGANVEAYKGIGRPDIETRILSLSLLIYIPGYFLFVRYGLEVFIVGRLLLTLAGLIIQCWYSKRYFSIGIIELLKQGTPVFILCIVVIGTYSFDKYFGQISYILSLGVFIIFVFKYETATVKRITEMIRKKPKK